MREDIESTQNKIISLADKVTDMIDQNKALQTEPAVVRWCGTVYGLDASLKALSFISKSTVDMSIRHLFEHHKYHRTYSPYYTKVNAMMTDIAQFGFSTFGAGRLEQSMKKVVIFQRWASMMPKKNTRKELMQLKYIDEAKEFYEITMLDQLSRCEKLVEEFKDRQLTNREQEIVTGNMLLL
jgi:hypothetical protein